AVRGGGGGAGGWGGGRYRVFRVTTGAWGGMAHLATHFGAVGPMIGASAAISGAMAGAMRFVFQRDGRPGFFRNDAEAARLPAQPLRATLRDPRFLLFVATWIGLNALFGFGTIAFCTHAGQELALPAPSR